jgi:NhaP-type Na+/H+ or K+/H+ antiporter
MGESVINDAVSLALYRAFEGFVVNGYSGSSALLKQAGLFFYLVIVSTLIGIVVGCIAAFQIKLVSSKMGMNVQATVIILWSYFAYAAAESCRVSGIISSVICGIIMNHFCKKNLSKEQKAYVNKVLLLLASFFDMCIFYMAGISIAFFLSSMDYELLLWMLPLCLVGRALNIFPMSAILNWFDSEDRITLKEQTVMWHAGLRGAIAFSIALHFPDNNGLRDPVIDCTSMIILLSVFCLGGTTKPLLNKMGIPMGVTDTHEDHLAAVKTATRNSKFKKQLQHFDKNVMRKLLIKKKMRHDSFTGLTEEVSCPARFGVRVMGRRPSALPSCSLPPPPFSSSLSPPLPLNSLTPEATTTMTPRLRKMPTSAWAWWGAGAA